MNGLNDNSLMQHRRLGSTLPFASVPSSQPDVLYGYIDVAPHSANRMSAMDVTDLLWRKGWILMFGRVEVKPD